MQVILLSPEEHMTALQNLSVESSRQSLIIDVECDIMKYNPEKARAFE